MKNIVRNSKIKLPNFLIVGAAKSGTTSLYYYLKQHPEIFLSDVREPCFISSQFINYPTKGIGDDNSFKRHIVTRFENYCKLFENAASKKAIGEAKWVIMLEKRLKLVLGKALPKKEKIFSIKLSEILTVKQEHVIYRHRSII